MVEAESALRHGETQVAESHYRAALLEGWLLRGRLDVEAGDLAAARDAFERARHSAATGIEPARRALALCRLHLGELDEALFELRLLARQGADDPLARQHLVAALVLAGKTGDAEVETEGLRSLAPQAAAAWRLKLEVPDPESRRRAVLPTIDTAGLEALDDQGRRRLRRAVIATLGRIYRNLAAMHAWAGRQADAERLRSVAGGLDPGSGEASHAFGRLDLDPREPPRPAAPAWLDVVSLQAAIDAKRLPATLGPVLLAIDGGRLEEAEHGLRDQVENGGGAEIRSLLGALLAVRGLPSEAEQELLAVTTAAPRLLSARQRLARLYSQQGRPDEATRQLRVAAWLGELDRDLGFQLAAAEIEAGRWPSARRQLDSLARRFDSARAHSLLAEVATQLGETKTAFDHTQKALQLAPNCQATLLAHARSSLAAGIPSSAAGPVEALARMAPVVAEYQYLLGMVWTGLGKVGEASQALLRAVALDPGHLPAMLALGTALNHESRFEEARTHLTTYLESDPGSLAALAALAEAEERLGDWQAAEERARGILELEPGDATANLVIGMVRIRQGRFEQAREALEAAVATDPRRAKAHYQLSFACARVGDRDCSREHLALYRKALEGPESEVLEMSAEPEGQAGMRKSTPGAEDR